MAEPARISACLLTDVRDTYLQCSATERLTRLGTIVFVTDQTNKVPHIWQSITSPDLVHAKIRRAIQNAADQPGFTG